FIINNPVSGVFAPAGGIFFNGSTGTDDLQLLGGTATTVEHVFTNANDGFVKYNGTTAITYTGLNPIVDTIASTNRTFTYNGSNETIGLTDAAGSASTIVSTLGESVTFANLSSPSGLLLIQSTTGTDTINLSSIDPAFDGN